ncbi:DNA polymerase III subunit delta' [Schaalia sp. lx-100]|uniref:DNA polymerase III subunit delta' n=1 Tax=Schaalia sp. lx-100 TaxID=2899081 RepID=UPI001E3603FE|nr:DNA polymerase III subunit delta' [Schaalia sp. lx-100]
MTVWDELVGQEAAVTVLQEAAVAARRVLENDLTPAGDTRSMTHSWLITGPPGSGRSVAARAFAAALQCAGQYAGCAQCAGCKTTLGRSHADVQFVSTEGTQLRVAEIRDLIGRAQLAPAQGRWRVIIIEDADRMSEHTSNVLLKAIEEPPERTVWILCAPSVEDMLPTIRSRCRHLGLRIPPAAAVASLLVRRDQIEPEIALAAARAAQSHIGLARALARDPQARQRRRDIVTAPVHVRSVGEAVLAAEQLITVAKEETRARMEERNSAERAELLRQLGADESDTRNRQTRARLRELEEEQKRRATRAIHDTLDRALVDLLAIYRDVLMIQLKTGQDLINVDLEDLVHQNAQHTTPCHTLNAITAIEVARRRLTANVQPQLLLEDMMMALRPASEN